MLIYMCSSHQLGVSPIGTAHVITRMAEIELTMRQDFILHSIFVEKQLFQI